MAAESFALEWWAWFQSFIWVILLLIGLIILYYIIKEIHDSKVTPRLAEIELEKEKLQLMKLDYAHRGQPFFRVTPEKLEEINTLDQENTRLEAEIFAKQNAVDQRIQRLENSVKSTKLDHLVEKIKDEERKIR
ncbi:hypothetical protein L1S32_05730 [Methanogenium sp. S4BF]|uniref:hypothetical protein n=1 Tax=Methanogenium sp. S4BF TaxID=1789226 RepID=UPI0024174707|nr:hypothetical protein [Methanogenium sp. S4BF]WFN35601.1 hypothetical protein L1S32_05730 [Methanogenium sp. S4BF]